MSLRHHHIQHCAERVVTPLPCQSGQAAFSLHRFHLCIQQALTQCSVVCNLRSAQVHVIAHKSSLCVACKEPCTMWAQVAACTAKTVEGGDLPQRVQEWLDSSPSISASRTLPMYSSPSIDSEAEPHHRTLLPPKSPVSKPLKVAVITYLGFWTKYTAVFADCGCQHIALLLYRAH